MMWINILWITNLTNRDLPTIDNNDDFEEANLHLILSAIAWKWVVFVFPWILAHQIIEGKCANFKAQRSNNSR